jgi:hypothetical protein
MISLKQLAGGVAVAALTMTIAAPVMAQQITSAVRGSVSSQNGSPVPGASVLILHAPTGTVRRVTTSANGSFSARGLKAGGPYTVSVTAPGMQAYRVNDVQLTLAETYNMDIVLGSEATQDEIIVTASAQNFGGLNSSFSSTFGADEIEGMATVDRSLATAASRDPLLYIDPTNSDAISIAGGNNRMLSVTVDGVANNDSFGLNNSGFPGLRSPISLDAVEQLSVQSTPFDVEFSGFQSGTLNIITKSGTNDFSGSAFIFRRSDGLAGDQIRGNAANVNIDEKTYGATLGGPIIKDKLFFFVAYDKFEGVNVFDTGPAGSGATNIVSAVTLQDVTDIINISNSVYNFDPLGLNSGDLTETDEKILAKVDWNITDRHRAQFTFQRNEGNEVRPQNTGGRSIGLLSHWYNNTQTLNTYTGNLFSDWTDNLSTEIKVSFKEKQNDQAPLGGTEFGLFQIRTAGGGTVFLGPDFFRHANDLSTETLLIKAKADYVWNNHLFTAGVENNSVDTFNLFVRGSRGSYTFNSIADFAAQDPTGGLFYNNSVTNDANDAAAEFNISVLSLYAQDVWDVRDDLTVQAGVRYERYSSTDNITPNANFLARHGFSNTETLDGRDIILPRIGFNWAAKDDLTIRGGVGLFSGGSPNVWISNNYSNDGVTIDSVFLFPGPGVDGFNVPLVAQNALVAGDGDVNALDPNFEIPSTWKLSLGFEKTTDLPGLGVFGENWDFSGDMIYSSVKSAPFWRDANCDGTATQQASDGRPIYSCSSNQTDIVLSSVGKGRGWVFTFSGQKEFENGWDLRGTYTHQNIKDFNSGSSSTASSNVGKNVTFDRQNPYLGSAAFERKHRITANVSYRTKWFGDNETRFSLFGEMRSGAPFSYTLDEPGRRGVLGGFGDNRDFNRRDTQLFYVPTGPGDPNVDFSAMSPSDQTALFAFIESSGLSEFSGKISPRNAFNSPWANRWDLRISQEIPGLFPKRAKGILYLDIRNVGNLLNDKWGTYEQVRFYFNEPIVSATVSATGQLEYNSFRGATNNRIFTEASLWSAQVGAKFKF